MNAFRSVNLLRSTALPRNIVFSTSIRTTTPTTTRLFSTTRRTSSMSHEPGTPIPDIDLTEGTPGNKVNLSKTLTGKGLIIGVPAAFSPSCSETHVPGYISSAKTKEAGDVFVVSVNDAFVMKAWGKSLEGGKESGIRYLADADGKFTKALGLDFDASAMLGNHRSKRYTLVVDGGKVQKAFVEPDNTGVKESAVENVLGA